jgi:hypothetical protein
LRDRPHTKTDAVLELAGLSARGKFLECFASRGVYTLGTMFPNRRRCIPRYALSVLLQRLISSNIQSTIERSYQCLILDPCPTILAMCLPSDSRDALRTVIHRNQRQFSKTVDGKVVPSDRHVHRFGSTVCAVAKAQQSLRSSFSVRECSRWTTRGRGSDFPVRSRKTADSHSAARELYGHEESLNPSDCAGVSRS